MGGRTDNRNVREGAEIPSESYCDQPYIVVTDDGNWLCVLTTGPGTESQSGQHVVATVSSDRGRTWSDLIDIEPSGPLRSSWVTAVKVPSGRVYAIYNYDHDGESTQHGGWLVYRFTDDHGRTWSPERHRIPLRATRWDRENVTGGRTQYFWCIDKPVLSEGVMYFGLPKLRNGLPLVGGESWVVCSDNISAESDPAKLHWASLPEGDDGILNPALGDIQEEQNIEVLSDGSLYMVLRTEIGSPAFTISRDRGRTWSTPEAMRYADGCLMRNPRACPRIWKASNGKFLFWYHNNGSPSWGNAANRNPVWVSGGVEQDGEIRWSQPEILLYDPDPTINGMSYPDFVEQDGRIWVSATQKTVARVHELDQDMLDAVWNQHDSMGRAADGMAFDSAGGLAPGAEVAIPRLPSLKAGGLTVELWIDVSDAPREASVVSSFGPKRRGFDIRIRDNGALGIGIHDGENRRWLEVVDPARPEESIRTVRNWDCYTESGLLHAAGLHHAVFIIDGCAGIVSFVVDGRLCDGGADRSQGWWRLPPGLDDLNDHGRLLIGRDFPGTVESLRIYDRHLLTSEAIASYRAGSRA